MNSTNSPNTIHAVLIDAASIQSYVFGSNKLKTNIGASFIVAEMLYGQLLRDSLAHFSETDHLIYDWEAEETLKMASQEEIQIEVGYIGGGNAIVFFRDHSMAARFVKHFSKEALLHFPGLRVLAAIESVATPELENNFQAFKARLEDKMRIVKNLGFAQTTIPKAGIIMDCPQSNEAADFQEKDNTWISSGTQIKLEASELSQKALRNKHHSFLGTTFSYPFDLSDLGQPDDKGYVAIVHIDGNGIGKRFEACQSLAALRDLSKKVTRIANDSMEELIQELTLRLPAGAPLREELNLRTKDGFDLLPIRPLMVGGDDIVFVCEGRLGIYLSEELIKLFCQKLTTECPSDKPVAACAGVAIVGTKYPFFRAYSLAEDLMRLAKTKSKDKENENENNDSWIAFMVSQGFNGSLEEILDNQFEINGKLLFGGPYNLNGAENSLSQVKNGCQHFQSKWPRNKLMELRDMMPKSADFQAYFMESLDARGLELPEKANALVQAEFGKYLDMIELTTFYPKHLL